MDAYEVDCPQIEAGFLLEGPMAMHQQSEDDLTWGVELLLLKSSYNKGVVAYVFGHCFLIGL